MIVCGKMWAGNVLVSLAIVLTWFSVVILVISCVVLVVKLLSRFVIIPGDSVCVTIPCACARLGGLILRTTEGVC